MANGAVNKPYAPDPYIKITSIATGASDSGFHISYPATISFTIFYFDVAGKVANIRKSSGASAVVTELHGNFVNSSADTTDVYLNVGVYDRASFQIVSANIDNITLSVY